MNWVFIQQPRESKNEFKHRSRQLLNHVPSIFLILATETFMSSIDYSVMWKKLEKINLYFCNFPREQIITPTVDERDFVGFCEFRITSISDNYLKPRLLLQDLLVNQVICFQAHFFSYLRPRYVPVNDIVKNLLQQNRSTWY